MRRLLGWITLGILLSSVATLPTHAQNPTLPGAEGFGAMATGGRRGQVIYVTNLKPSGPGSLQAVQDHNGTQFSLSLLGVNGYTNIEIYLHLLAEMLVSGS